MVRRMPWIGQYILGSVIAIVSCNATAQFVCELDTGTSIDAEPDDSFGGVVAISGSTMVIGAVYDDESGLRNTGSVCIFERTGARHWDQIKKLISPNAEDSGWFGDQVALHGDLLAVTAAREYTTQGNGFGVVYLFERNSGGTNNWGLLKVFEPSVLGYFGSALSLDPDRLAIGASGRNSDSTLGRVHIYDRDAGGANAWGLVKFRFSKVTST